MLAAEGATVTAATSVALVVAVVLAKPFKWVGSLLRPFLGLRGEVSVLVLLLLRL